MTTEEELVKALEVLNAHCLSETRRSCQNCCLEDFCTHMVENYYGTLAQAFTHFEERRRFILGAMLSAALVTEVVL